MHKAYLLLGSNVGDRFGHLLFAREQIGRHAGWVSNASKIYETEPWGMKSARTFYNQALLLETIYSAHQLLNILLNIEQLAGRIRAGQWEDRTLDIDIILFNDEVISDDRLTIPHKLLAERNFTLKPLAEIAKDVLHPILNESIGSLLAHSEDQREVSILGV